MAPIMSDYPDLARFEAAMDEAARELARGHRFRMEREVLGVIAVFLVVLSAEKLFVILLGTGDPFIAGRYLLWAWLAWCLWGGWYVRRVVSLRQRLVERRLCMCCGEPLIDVPVDDRGRGLCPECGTAFGLGEYVPPAGCVDALKHARARVCEAYPIAPRLPRVGKLPTRPFYLYRDGAHYDRAMIRAASRIIAVQASTIRISLVSLVVMMLAVLLMGLWVVGQLFWMAMPVVVLVTAGAFFYEFTRVRGFGEQVRSHRLCLRCGYSLGELPLDGRGGGVCPECGRPYHVLEYTRPPDGWEESSWREWRSLAVLGPAAPDEPTSRSIAVTRYPEPPGDPRLEATT